MDKINPLPCPDFTLAALLKSSCEDSELVSLMLPYLQHKSILQKIVLETPTALSLTPSYLAGLVIY